MNAYWTLENLLNKSFKELESLHVSLKEENSSIQETHPIIQTFLNNDIIPLSRLLSDQTYNSSDTIASNSKTFILIPSWLVLEILHLYAFFIFPKQYEQGYPEFPLDIRVSCATGLYHLNEVKFDPLAFYEHMLYVLNHLYEKEFPFIQLHHKNQVSMELIVPETNFRKKKFWARKKIVYSRESMSHILQDPTLFREFEQVVQVRL